MKRYRMIDSTIVTISQGEFTATVKDGTIELPDEIAWNFLQLGLIAPLNTEYVEKVDDGLHKPAGRLTATVRVI
jgi:predicted PP-loop superfamily ATPase